jgi:hypothetical protein
MLVQVWASLTEMLEWEQLKKSRQENLDLYARIHRATGDCQNEVERTQAAVGRAIVHGGSIKWKPKCIEENDDAKQLTVDEYEKLEKEITIYNVFEIFFQ